MRRHLRHRQRQKRPKCLPANEEKKEGFAVPKRRRIGHLLPRLLDAHQVIIRETRALAHRASVLGDDGTNELVVSEVLRTKELQVWFLSEHLVSVPLVKAQAASGAA